MPDARLGDQYESREFGEERPEMGIWFAFLFMVQDSGLLQFAPRERQASGFN